MRDDGHQRGVATIRLDEAVDDAVAPGRRNEELRARLRADDARGREGDHENVKAPRQAPDLVHDRRVDGLYRAKTRVYPRRNPVLRESRLRGIALDMRMHAQDMRAGDLFGLAGVRHAAANDLLDVIHGPSSPCLPVEAQRAPRDVDLRAFRSAMAIGQEAYLRALGHL